MDDIFTQPMEKLFDVILEDDNLLVINKPAGLVCHPTKAGPHSSLIGRVRLHLGADADAHLVNRLDRETSGLVVVAKNADVATELRKVWEKRLVHKEYSAIVHGHLAVEHGAIDAPLGKDVSSGLAIKDTVRPDGAVAFTEYWVEERFERDGRPFSVLQVVPRTGRKHQIRIHMAHIGHPIVGDKMYGGDEQLYLSFVVRELTDEQRARLILPYQALHARSLRFEWRGREWQFDAEPEASFKAFIRGEPGEPVWYDMPFAPK